MTHLHTWLMIALTAFVLAGMPATSWQQQAYAQAGDFEPKPNTSEGDTKTRGEDGSVISCADVPEAQGGALIGKIVPCLVYTIEQATISFAEQVAAFLTPLFFAFLLMVVVFFGVRVASREPEIYKQGFLLLVKIAIVGAILGDLGNTASYDGQGGGGKLIPAVYGIMNESQSVVASSITTTNLTCDVNKYAGPETPKIWAIMDCVMGKLYGFSTGYDPTTGKTGTSMLLMTSVVGLMTGVMFGGAWGVAIFFGMVAALFSLFMLVIRTITSFISGYLIMCLMLIIAPLFLPLVFLRGTTTYFDQYLRTVMAAFLTPLIITTYTMFALMVYDKLLFAEDSIIQNLFKYEKIKDALNVEKKPCDRQVVGDPIDVRFEKKPTEAELTKMFSLPQFQNLAFPTLSGGNDLCGNVKVPNFKLSAIKDYKDGDLEKMFMELLQLFILAYLVAEGQKALPSIITQLVGRRSTAALSQSIETNDGSVGRGIEGARNAAMASFQKGEKPSDGYKSGGQYIKDLPRDLPNSASASREAFFNAFKK